MQVSDSVWQGCFGYWQPLFIQTNLLPLGHAAWQGYVTQGQGLVSCNVEVIDAKILDWSRDVVRYNIRFIPAGEMPIYLRSHLVKANFTERLMATVQTYHPDQDILIAICSDGQININLLQNLAISPPDCYRQVRNRWEEFALELSQ
ncbi:hypothetical protein IQ241_20080 [Romeria aff. gracilis LEGE 07310]|uniref:Uncharacterized protein n=1 Tax=Vasconcelosia minhoensis LEGE 07310 TaxID=915328 RepID=A0A8J7DD60_9CYAN|nr:hypothetical protein [Romeria gracilis]MBE9079567.1 hypothetical protein [Romeria aff. gracilis LEGE 07310]